MTKQRKPRRTPDGYVVPSLATICAHLPAELALKLQVSDLRLRATASEAKVAQTSRLSRSLRASATRAALLAADDTTASVDRLFQLGRANGLQAAARQFQGAA